MHNRSPSAPVDSAKTSAPEERRGQSVQAAAVGASNKIQVRRDLIIVLTSACHQGGRLLLIDFCTMLYLPQKTGKLIQSKLEPPASRQRIWLHLVASGEVLFQGDRKRTSIETGVGYR